MFYFLYYPTALDLTTLKQPTLFKPVFIPAYILNIYLHHTHTHTHTHIYIYIYIYIYIGMIVCACVITNPFVRVVCDTRTVF